MDPNPDNDRSQPRLSQPASRRRDVRLTALHGVATVIVDFTGTVEAQDLSVGGVRVLTSSPLAQDRNTGVCFTPESFPGSTIQELVDAILSAQLHLS